MPNFSQFWVNGFTGMSLTEDSYCTGSFPLLTSDLNFAIHGTCSN